MTVRPKPLIAIVDDDESVCRALKRLVRSLDMDAQAFGSGQVFLELLETPPPFRPDCVVLDIQMPGVNGIEVQTRIRRVSASLPVIFITAYEDEEARARALAGGAVACLRKPFNDAVFAKTLQAAFERGPRATTTER